MSGNDIIAQMIQDTFEELDETPNNVLSFKQPEDFFELEAHFDGDKKCYIISNGHTELEIPMNWGPFKNRIASEFILSAEDDKEYFLPIISEFLEKDIQCLKVSLSVNESLFDIRGAA